MFNGKGSRAASRSILPSGSRIPTLLLSMFASFASIYVAGRLWQDAQNRVYLMKELDKITGKGQYAVSVDDTLKLIACRESKQRLSVLQQELVEAKLNGFHSDAVLDNEDLESKKKLTVVIGVMTTFGERKNRIAVRNAWMGTGLALKKLENEKGVVARFVIGRSEKRGDELDRSIDSENRATNDFFILDEFVENEKELPNKAKLFFASAANQWDAEFYVKVKDNLYLNIDALSATLAAHMEKPRSYIGCMKSGEVFSDSGHIWYEPDWWKFGDRKSYFRHAAGEIYAISRPLAQFISINKSILRSYAHDDITAGSWFIGLDVNHIDERKFCCSSWSTGSICSSV